MPRDSLFDLAVNRALSYALRLGLTFEATELRGGLELWYLKTRFTYRVPLDEIVSALQNYPGEGYFWEGGQAGDWHRGESPLL